MGDNMVDQMLSAWQTNNRINLFLIDRITNEGLRCTLSSRGGRDVARQFAHMHDVRVWALQTRAKDLSTGLNLFASKQSPRPQRTQVRLVCLGTPLDCSTPTLSLGSPNVGGSKKGWVSHLSYFIAHESRHRGSILLTLKQSGHPLDQERRYAIWSWDKM